MVASYGDVAEDGHGDGSTSFICRMKDDKISRCGRKRSGDCRANQTNKLILWHDQLLLSSSPLTWTSSATQSYDPKVSSRSQASPSPSLVACYFRVSLKI